MKKTLLSVLISAISLSVCAEEAYPKLFSSGSAEYHYYTAHTLEIAPEIYQYKYEEPGLMENDGLYYGVNLNYVYSIHPDPADIRNPFGKKMERLYFGLESRYAEGRVDYESNGTGTMDDIDDYVAEVRGIFGFETMLTKSLSLSPYFGFGYRYLNNDSGNRQTTTGHRGYERESNYYYLPVGARMVLDVTSTTLIGASIEADVFLSGKQRSHIGDVVPGYETVKNDQESGYGARASVFIEHEFDTASVFIEPYIRYWDVDNSEIAMGSDFTFWIEPENKTVEAGLRFGAAF